MTKRPNYKVFQYLLAVGEQVTISHSANSLTCLDADAGFKIGFGDAPLTPFEKGLGYTAETDFKKIRILNENAGPINVKLGFASGGVTDSRLNIAGSLSASIFGGSTIAQNSVSALAAAATVVAAVNLNRNELLVSNLGTDTVFLGGAGILANTGLPLAGGATATLETTAAVSVYNPAAAAVSLAVMELSK